MDTILNFIYDEGNGLESITVTGESTLEVWSAFKSVFPDAAIHHVQLAHR